MILRRVTEHVKAQNWFAVGIDFLIVVVGVFVGLQVQQWADAQRQGRLERLYTERLQDEVVSLMGTRAPLVEMRNRINAGLATTTQLLFSTEDRGLADFECQSIAYSYIISNPTDDLASLIELQSTGQLAVISDPRVSAALGAYLLTRARTRDAHAGIVRSMLNLQVRHPDLVQVVVPGKPAASSPSYGVFRCGLDGMRASRQFLNDYEINQTNFALHVNDNARVDASLNELNRVLMDVLGLTGKTVSP